jgi:hypothetical protein
VSAETLTTGQWYVLEAVVCSRGSEDTGFVSEVFISFVREGGKVYTFEPLDPDTGIFLYIHHVMVLSDHYIFHTILKALRTIKPKGLNRIAKTD